MLEALEVFPDDEFELQSIYNQVDTENKGYITLEDFEKSLASAALNADVSTAIKDFITPEKLGDLKCLFEFHQKMNYAIISEMRAELAQFSDSFTLEEFDVFFINF